MTVRAYLPVYDPFHVLRNPSVRMGIYVGIILSTVLSAWVLFSLACRVLCMDFKGLAERFSIVQIFMPGAILYMLVVSLSWIWTIIRLACALHVSHPNFPRS